MIAATTLKSRSYFLAAKVGMADGLRWPAVPQVDVISTSAREARRLPYSTKRTAVQVTLITLVVPFSMYTQPHSLQRRPFRTQLPSMPEAMSCWAASCWRGFTARQSGSGQADGRLSMTPWK
jgi:hypothetical protein